MEPVEARLVRGARVAMRQNLIDHRLAADARDPRFACRINVGHQDTIRRIEGGTEFLAQSLSAREAMRLKHRQDAVAAGRASGRQRRADLGWMMRVIVDQKVAFAGVLDLKATTRVLEMP